MKKYMIIAIVSFLSMVTIAGATLTTDQIYLLNNKMGSVPYSIRLGTLLAGIEAVANSALANGKIWIGNGAGTATAVTPSGDITMSNSGGFTITAGKVTPAKIALGDGAIMVGNSAGAAVGLTMTGDVTLTNLGASAIGATKVTKAMLAAALQPSHVIKYAGSSTSESDADATVSITITGAAATDVAHASLRAAANDIYLKKVTVSTDLLTVTLSGNGGAGTVVDYSILRAAP